MNNRVIKENSAWLKKKGVDDKLITLLQQNLRLRHIVTTIKRGREHKESKLSNPILIKRSNKKRRPVDSLDAFARLATSRSFAHVFKQKDITDFIFNHGPVLAKLTDPSNKIQRDRAIRFFLTVAKANMDPAKREILLKQRTFELYQEGRLTLKQIENCTVGELQQKIKSLLYNEDQPEIIRNERRTELKHIVSFAGEGRFSKSNCYYYASQALQKDAIMQRGFNQTQPIGKLAYVFNDDCTKVRIYRTTNTNCNKFHGILT